MSGEGEPPLELRSYDDLDLAQRAMFQIFAQQVALIAEVVPADGFIHPDPDSRTGFVEVEQHLQPFQWRQRCIAVFGFDPLRVLPRRDADNANVFRFPPQF